MINFLIGVAAASAIFIPSILYRIVMDELDEMKHDIRVLETIYEKWVDKQCGVRENECKS